MQKYYKIIGGSVIGIVLVLYYVSYGMRISIIHPDTHHGDGSPKMYFYSKNLFNVFYHDCEYDCKGGGAVYKKTRIPSADPKTFEVLSEHYTKDINNAFICSNDSDYRSKIKCEIIEKADPVSFSAIGTVGRAIYAKDKNYVYVLEKVIEGADTATFSLVNHFANYLYAKDKNFVYKSGQIIKGADPATFSLIRHNGSLDNAHAKDKNFVYKSGEVIDGADTSTFSLVDIYDERYAKDENRVYLSGKTIENADPATFSLVGDTVYGQKDYAKDENRVYLSGKTIENADPATFSLVGDTVYGQKDYAKDENRVYLSGKTIENADPLSFSLVGDEFIDGRDHTYAKDANHVYRSGEIIKGADPATFSLIYPDTNQDSTYNASYAKDANHVYIFGKVIVGADVQTFRMIDQEFLKDKNKGGFSRFAVDKNSIYFTDYDGNLYSVMDIESISDLDYFFGTGMEQFKEQRRAGAFYPLLRYDT